MSAALFSPSRSHRLTYDEPIVTKGLALPDVDHPPMTADRLQAFTPYYLDALVWVWAGAERATLLTGAEVGPLPTDGALWVITACDPDGREFHIEENIARHADLLAVVDAESAGPGQVVPGRDADDGHAGPRWWPAVGAAIDGTHHELSVALCGITEARACALGRRFGQLAIFEITADYLRLVPCIDAAPLTHRARQWCNPADIGVSEHHLDLWRHQHDRAAERAAIAINDLVH